MYSPLSAAKFNQNLLLDKDGNIKISDFGLSALYVGDADAEGNARAELLHTTCGTPNYVAPEVLANQGYDGKLADVWSIGVILYVLLAGFLPFEESTMVALFQKIKNADFTYPQWFSDGVKQLLDAILVADPHRRLSLKEVRDHPWVVDGEAYPDNSTSAAGSSEANLEKSRDAQLAKDQDAADSTASDKISKTTNSSLKSDGKTNSQNLPVPPSRQQERQQNPEAAVKTGDVADLSPAPLVLVEDPPVLKQSSVEIGKPTEKVVKQEGGPVQQLSEPHTSQQIQQQQEQKQPLPLQKQQQRPPQEHQEVQRAPPQKQQQPQQLQEQKQQQQKQQPDPVVKPNGKSPSAEANQNNRSTGPPPSSGSCCTLS